MTRVKSDDDLVKSLADPDIVKNVELQRINKSTEAEDDKSLYNWYQKMKESEKFNM